MNINFLIGLLVFKDNLYPLSTMIKSWSVTWEVSCMTHGLI